MKFSVDIFDSQLWTYLLKWCQESMLDIWPSSGLCKHSKLCKEIWKCEHSSSGLFWTRNCNLIVPVYVFLWTYLLKWCQESMLDIWPSSGLCKHSKLCKEIRKCEHSSSGLQVDFFWTRNYIPIVPVYVFLQTYLLKWCQESILDIWPSSGLCKHSKLCKEIQKCEHSSSGLFLD